MLELGGRASAIVLKLQKRSWWPRREQPPQVTLPGEAAPGLEPALCLLGGDSASLRGLESRLCGSRAAEAGLGPASSPGSAGEGMPPGACGETGRARGRELGRRHPHPHLAVRLSQGVLFSSLSPALSTFWPPWCTL